jgi:hypothetical protein
VSEVLQQAKLLEGTPNIAENEVRKQANLIIDDYLTTGDLEVFLITRFDFYKQFIQSTCIMIFFTGGR